MLNNKISDCRTTSCEHLEGRVLVHRDQSAVANNIGGEYRSKATFDRPIFQD